MLSNGTLGTTRIKLASGAFGPPPGETTEFLDDRADLRSKRS